MSTKIDFNQNKMMERFKSLRGDLTQDELGRKINYSRQAINKMEKGESLPSLDALIKLRDLYHVSFDYLLGVSEYTSQDIEDLGEPLGLSEESINALKMLKQSHIETNQKREYASEEDKYISLISEVNSTSDEARYKAISAVINLVLEQILIDDQCRNDDKTPFRFPIDNLFLPMFQYVYSDFITWLGKDLLFRFDNEDDKNDVLSKTERTYLIVDYDGDLKVMNVNKAYRARLKEEIIEKLDDIRESVRKRGGSKHGNNSEKRK